MPAKAPVLRAWRDPQRDVLVRLTRWAFQEPVSGQYFEREASASILWNYLRRYGPMTVLRKVRSRLAERGRNAKVAGVAHGVVIEAPAGADLPLGAPVLFVAPNAARGAEELVIDHQLVVRAPDGPLENAQLEVLQACARSLKGYSRWSGAPLPNDAREALHAVANAPHSSVGQVATRTVDRVAGSLPPAAKPTAVIFGLGNYAKTLIIPNIRQRLQLTCVHDIDPEQFAFLRGTGVALDTCPMAREGENYDVWFIAGYHHTHADLAVQALRRGAYAVVEKPIATTPKQLAALQEEAVADPGGKARLFACFQKRYAAFNRFVHADLGVRPHDPVHMSALVYEVPLPPLHWYTWPNSGSRIVSNGCHWLDYFMWVNEFSPVLKCTARRSDAGDVHCLVTLQNGAGLFLELTHNGSPRVGVREMMELRSQDATIRIVDAATYVSENASGTIRRMRVNPVTAFSAMYQRIAEVIASGGAGDRLESYRSTELMLELEADLLAVRPTAAVARKVP